jgi:hypothetical protein
MQSEIRLVVWYKGAVESSQCKQRRKQIGSIHRYRMQVGRVHRGYRIQVEVEVESIQGRIQVGKAKETVSPVHTTDSTENRPDDSRCEIEQHEVKEKE